MFEESCAVKMSSLCVNEKWIAVSRGKLTCIRSLWRDTQFTLELPPPPPPAKPSKSKSSSEVVDQNESLGLEFSSCGKWFALYTSSKQLVLWETTRWTLVSCRLIPKAASSLKFTPDSAAIIVVDKAGDAISFSVREPEIDGSIILGHLSMLLDVVLSLDGLNIITCDRDEKIRVSCFPNAYNIVSYCLGHKEFVSSVCLLPHNSSCLISSSGDGTIRLWEFKTGSALSLYDCSKDTQEKLTIDASSQQAEIEKRSTVIVKKLVCSRLNEENSLACAVFHGFNGCLVYKISAKSITVIEALCINKAVVDIGFASSGELFLHLYSDEDALLCYTFDENSNTFSCNKIKPNLREALEGINSYFNSVTYVNKRFSEMPLLLKRKYDNVKDYYEQKKARIGEL